MNGVACGIQSLQIDKASSIKGFFSVQDNDHYPLCIEEKKAEKGTLPEKKEWNYMP